jgi:hypothetical protein
MKRDGLTVKEAYAAMYDFLEQVYDRTKSDTLGSLLGDMSTTADGMPADEAVWSDWEQSVEKAAGGGVKTDIELH